MTTWAELENRRPDEIRQRHIAFRAKIAGMAVDDSGISCLSASLRSGPVQPIGPPVIVIAPKTEPEPIAKPWFWIVDEVNGPPPIKVIQRIVAEHYDISMNDLVSARRDAVVIRPRQLAMYLSKVLTLHTLPQIGRRFGDRDHTTVLHAIRKMTALIAGDPEFAAEVERIKAEIPGAANG